MSSVATLDVDSSNALSCFPCKHRQPTDSGHCSKGPRTTARCAVILVFQRFMEAIFASTAASLPGSSPALSASPAWGRWIPTITGSNYRKAKCKSEDGRGIRVPWASSPCPIPVPLASASGVMPKKPISQKLLLRIEDAASGLLKAFVRRLLPLRAAEGEVVSPPR